MGMAYSSHKTSYVWLVSTYGGVQGFTVEELNYYIDFYNKSNDRYYVDFWEWLHTCYGYNVHGFSYLNDGNPLISKLHSIKSRINECVGCERDCTMCGIRIEKEYDYGL